MAGTSTSGPSIPDRRCHSPTVGAPATRFTVDQHQELRHGPVSITLDRPAGATAPSHHAAHIAPRICPDEFVPGERHLAGEPKTSGEEHGDSPGVGRVQRDSQQSGAVPGRAASAGRRPAAGRSAPRRGQAALLTARGARAQQDRGPAAAGGSCGAAGTDCHRLPVLPVSWLIARKRLQPSHVLRGSGGVGGAAWGVRERPRPGGLPARCDGPLEREQVRPGAGPVGAAVGGGAAPPVRPVGPVVGSDVRIRHRAFVRSAGRTAAAGPHGGRGRFVRGCPLSAYGVAASHGSQLVRWAARWFRTGCRCGWV